MDEQHAITLVATENTPANYRRSAGRKYPIRPDQPLPVPGARGTLFGVPGVMRDGPEGLEWEMTEPLPTPPDPGPPWAQALASEIAEVKRLLQERS